MLNDGGTTTAQPSLIKKHITHVHYQTNNWLNFSVYGFAWESGNPVQRLRSMRQIQHNILRLYWGRPQLYFFLSIIQFGSTYHGQRKFFFFFNWHFGWNRQEWLRSVWLVREVLYQNWDHFEMVVAQSFRHLTADFPFIYTHAEYDYPFVSHPVVPQAWATTAIPA